MAGIQDNSVDMMDGVPAITCLDVNERINESSGDNADAQPWQCARQANDLGCVDMCNGYPLLIIIISHSLH